MNDAVTGIAELALETSSLGAMERFYVEVVGLSLLDRAEDRIWLSAGGQSRLGLWSIGAKEYGDRGGRHVHFALSASGRELEAIAHRLGASDVRVTGPVTHDGGDRSIYFRDPEGNLVEIWDYFEDGDGADAGTDALA